MQKMLSHLRRCIDEYKMIDEGDKIAIGVSGGKDSLVLLRTMAELRRFYPKKFELVAITLDMGYEGADFSTIAQLCRDINVEYIIKPTNIREVVLISARKKIPVPFVPNCAAAALTMPRRNTAATRWLSGIILTMLLRLSCFRFSTKDV